MKANLPLTRSFCVLVALAATSLVTPKFSILAENSNVAGTWKWTVTRGDRSFDSSVTFEQDGSQLTGTYHTRRGDTPISNGKVKESEVSFDVTREFQGNSFTVHYKGEVEGNNLVGFAVFGEGERTFDWDAKRAGPVVDPTGKWTWKSRGRNGEDSERVLHLKLDDGKLTGAYAGRQSESPISEAKLNGDEIAFKVVREFNDREIVINFSGKIEGDSIVGRTFLKMGDRELDREWNAKRESAGVDPTGEWDFVLTIPDGNTFEATLELKLANGKLSGELIGESFEVELKEATVSGNTISFVTENDDGTQSYHSKGTIEGDRIEATVTIESDEGERKLNWVAERR